MSHAQPLESVTLDRARRDDRRLESPQPFDSAMLTQRVFEAGLFGLIASNEDMRDGTAAVLRKRKPQFKGK